MYIYNSTGVTQYVNNVIGSEGCYIIDDNGNKYLDLESGVWCLPLGHKNPVIVNSMKEQIDKVSHVHYKYNDNNAEMAAEQLIRITGIEQGKCIFLSSGSEAVDLGISMAKKICQNKKCVVLSNQYLAAYGYASDTDSDEWVKISWNSEENHSDEEWSKILDNVSWEEIGCFVFEAGNSSGLVKLPPQNLVKLIAEKVHHNKGYIVTDEITCGMGRTGKWFGFMQYEIKPDIIAIGKGLGNGYPVSAVVMKEKVAKELDKIHFHYSQSHQNDPLGCRIAYEVIEQIERNHLLQRVNEMGDYLRTELGKIMNGNTYIEQVRGVGLLSCIQLSEELTEENMMKIDRYFIENRMIVGINTKARCVRTYMPFIIEKEMIDLFVEKMSGIQDILS